MTTLSTAPTQAALRESIARYWGANPDNIEITDDGRIINNGVTMYRHRVVKARGRWRFEMTGA